MKQVTALIPIRRTMKLRQQEVKNLCKVTELIKGRAGNRTHAIQATSLCSYPLYDMVEKQTLISVWSCSKAETSDVGGPESGCPI